MSYIMKIYDEDSGAFMCGYPIDKDQLDTIRKRVNKALPPVPVTLTRKLISKGDLESFLKKITDPREICPRCAGDTDCIGVEECYPAEHFLLVEMRITQPTQEQIRRLLNK